MSYLNWEQQTRAVSGTNNTVFTNYWELWNMPAKDREWYDDPVATIHKIKDRRYQLELSDDDNELGAFHFTTLKAAKAMGIVLTRME
jgi:hypothetical protein